MIERIDYWPEVIDHVSRKCPLPVSIPEAWRSEVLAMVLVSDQVMGCHVSLMTVHVVGHSPFLMLDCLQSTSPHYTPHLDVLPLIVPVIVLLVPVLLIREGTSGVQRLISVTAEPLPTTHLG